MTKRERRAKLRAFMKQHALTAPQIAAIVERRPQTVRAWRSGARAVPLGSLAALYTWEALEG